MKRIKIAIPIVLSVSMLFSFKSDEPVKKISFQSDKLYPEGITYDDKRELVYLSSLTLGKIVSVDKSGNCKTVCDDPRLISTVGIKYNNKTGKLYALNGDMGMFVKSGSSTKFNLAQLAIIDVASSKIEDLVDLSGLVTGKHLMNDLTLDTYGNVYITDSYAHVVYKVNKNKKASVFAQSLLFKPDSNTLGLNGIAYNKEGYLLVAKSVEGSLLKISTNDSTMVERVALPEPMFWTDGIYFINEKDLVIVRNRFTKTVFLHSDSHWETASVVKEEKNTDLMPTTVTASKTNVYVINSRLSEIMKGTSNNYVIDVFELKTFKK